MKQVSNFTPITTQGFKLAIVGEAPGEEEERIGMPFMGASGHHLNKALGSVGIQRNACYIGNCYQFRPANNDINSVDQTNPLWSMSIQALHSELKEYQPDAIVILCQTSKSLVLPLLTGKYGIMKWRGSVLFCTLDGLQHVHVVPALHPAAILRQYQWAPTLEVDLLKAKDEAINKQPLPRRNIQIARTAADAINNLKSFACLSKVSIDIETTIGNIPRLLCFGIGTSANNAYVIPIGEVFSCEDEFLIMQEIQKLMENERVGKIIQNAMFDSLYLFERYGIITKGLWMDTMIAQHACYPELPKSLAFQTSVYTREPYYKDEGRQEAGDEKGWLNYDPNRLYIYNGKDCCVTYEIAEHLAKEMQELQVEGGYRLGMDALPLALEMTARGFRIDQEQCRKEQELLDTDIIASDLFVYQAFGKPVNSKSPLECKQLLYNELGLPKQFKRDKNGALKLTVESKALIRLMKFYPEVELLLHNRQLRTKRSFFEPDCWLDGRFHAGYNVVGTETGRWSSSSCYMGARNIMNIPAEINKITNSDGLVWASGCRTIYIPDNGMTLLGWDKAQAEARFVAYKAYVCTGDDTYKKLVESKQKIHIWFGCRLIDRNIFTISKDEFLSRETALAEQYYFIAKMSVHAFSYGLKAPSFVDMLMDETDGAIILELKKANAIKESLYADISAIPAWQEAVRQHVLENRVMFNQFGRGRIFFGRPGEDLFKEAYSTEPQGTVADDVSKSIERCARAFPNYELLQQNYDSCLGQCPKHEAEETMLKMRPLVETPITIWSFDKKRKIDLTIPVVFKIGDQSWGTMKELK